MEDVRSILNPNHLKKKIIRECESETGIQNNNKIDSKLLGNHFA